MDEDNLDINDINNNSNFNAKYIGAGDFENTLTQLTEKKICPFYYFLNLIQTTNPDIVVCTYNDFFDMKSRIQITKLISSNNNDNIEYKLIFDNCADIDNTISWLYSMNIDENLLFNAANQLFILKESYESKSSTLNEFEQNYKLLNPEVFIPEENIYNNAPENEFLVYNGLAVNNKIINSDTIRLPGTIRKPIHFLNLISKLMTFFKKDIFNPIKTESVWNIYTFQQQLLKELWLDFRSLRYAFRRLIILMNEMRNLDYKR
jgi:hypothetical protein